MKKYHWLIIIIIIGIVGYWYYTTNYVNGVWTGIGSENTEPSDIK